MILQIRDIWKTTVNVQINEATLSAKVMSEVVAVEGKDEGRSVIK